MTEHGTAVVARRSYDNTKRLQQAAATRERILAAGSELLRSGPVRDWQRLTVRAVAERAGVNERTIYRHFDNERGLRDAVMHRFEEEAGIELGAVTLDDVGGLTTRLLEHVSSFPRPERPPLDPTLSDARARQHAALTDAVAAHTAGSSPADRAAVAAVIDLLGSVAAFERLTSDWGLENGPTIRTLAWAVDVVAAAIRDGALPSNET